MNVLQEFSLSFGSKMWECGNKLNYADGMAQDILDFWNDDYKLNNLGLGCLIVCAMVAFDLVGKRGDLVVSNAEGYLMANGADEMTARTLIDLYTACHEGVSGTHHCEIALMIADCFRRDVWQLNWGPDVKAMVLTRKSSKDCPDYVV